MVSVQKLFQTVKKYIWLMILFAVIGGAVFGAFSRFLIAPKFSSTVKFFVNNTGNNAQGTISSSDVTAAKNLVSTYIVIFQSDTCLTAIAERSGIPYTPNEIKDLVKAGSLSQTEAFYITFSSEDPNEAFALASAASEILPDEIKRVVDSGRVSVIDYPVLDTEKDSPHNSLNTVIGAFLGFALSFAVLFLREVMDITIRSEEDLTEVCSYPIIGIIPTQITRNGEKAARRKAFSGDDE